MAYVETLPARPVPFATLTAVSLALLGVALAWGLVDTRLLEGVPVWMKPAKFALSFVVHFGTLALIAGRLSPAVRDGRAVALVAAAMGAAFLGEIGYMTVQAAQAEASHFNTGTTFHAVMFQLMGLGALVLVVGPVLLARVAWRDAAAEFGPATRAGVWWGAVVSCGLTLVVAGYMSSGSGHFVGTPSEGAAVLPFVGWSAEVGDLRPAHFLSLHAFQALPLLGLWLDRTGRGAGQMRWAALAWAALTLAVFGQALMGWPLVAL